VEGEKAGGESNEQQGALAAQKKGLKIDSDDDDTILEEAIKLAAAEKKDLRMKDRENCKHGHDPSPSMGGFCRDFMTEFVTFFNENENSYVGSDGDGGDFLVMRLLGAYEATKEKFENERDRYQKEGGEQDPDLQCFKYCLAEGTRNILTGDCDKARLFAMSAVTVAGFIAPWLQCKEGRFQAHAAEDSVKIFELQNSDKHTLVKYFRKKISCSCLDEEYEEVKHVRKMGLCMNQDCSLPDRKAERSKMFCCTNCRTYNYCSRKCQEAAWKSHKTTCQLLAMKNANEKRWDETEKQMLKLLQSST
jgi:hypothetical protein